VGNAQQATLLKNYGSVIGAISSVEFTASNDDSVTYFNTTTATVVNGLTINGDIYYTGKLINKYLSLSIDMQYLYNQQGKSMQSFSPYDYTNIIFDQNPIIANYISLMYPPINSNSYNLYDESGLPIGSEVRVMIHTPSNQNTNHSYDDYQVRRFSIVYDPGSQQNKWEPVNVYAIPGHTTLINIVPNPNPSFTPTWTNVPG
jgi:hypothetical protein